MNPNTVYKNFKQAIKKGDVDIADDAYYSLIIWLAKKGFEPSWNEEERAEFHNYKPSDNG